MFEQNRPKHTRMTNLNMHACDCQHNLQDRFIAWQGCICLPARADQVPSNGVYLLPPPQALRPQRAQQRPAIVSCAWHMTHRNIAGLKLIRCAYIAAHTASEKDACFALAVSKRKEASTSSDVETKTRTVWRLVHASGRMWTRRRRGPPRAQPHARLRSRGQRICARQRQAEPDRLIITFL